MIHPVLTEPQAHCLLALAKAGKQLQEASTGKPASSTQRDALQIIAAAIEREETGHPFEVYPDHAAMRRVASGPSSVSEFAPVWDPRRAS